MEVVYRSHTTDEGNDFESSIIKTGHKFWFSAEDIIGVLGYKNPADVCLNVRSETWKKWGEFNPSKVEMEQVPSYMLPMQPSPTKSR